jgi:bifunctional UDP-N-acetylglucosamine pyrophosphorylase / glucosamine-1-phosphate N-acetyltransferase
MEHCFMQLSVIILAAGEGKRMKSSLPKVLHCLAGRPLLDYVLKIAEQLKADKTYVIHGHHGEKILEAFSDSPITWVEQAELLGTGHAVMQVLPFLQDNQQVLILSGDVPFIAATTLKKLINVAGENAIGWLTAQVADPFGLGRVVRDENGKPIAIVEEKDTTSEQKKIKEINSGICVIPAKYLKEWLPQLKNNNAQKEYYLTDLFAMAVENGVNIATAQPQSITEVLSVNDKIQLSQLERTVQKQKAQAYMQEGLTLLDPDRFDVRGELTFGKDVIVDVNVIIEGKVKLGSNCRIGSNVILKDTVIGDGAIIKANTIIEEAEIGAECEIGPFARVRPGTKLAHKARLGNFVETKKVHVGEGSKINHLSYIGDAEVGKGVNIGAGTITCNYDGVNKHKTEIGDGAFIGSTTQLVAPVKIGKGATIGAGSTITTDTPADKLTLSRAKQVTMEDWKKPEKY